MTYPRTAHLSRFGTSDALCNATMRERHPRSGFGFALTFIVVIAATFLALTSIIERFPRQ